MKHDDQTCTLIAWSKQPFLGSIHNGARPRHLARASLRHLARREVSVQVRARRLREHEVVRGVVGAHPPVGPGSGTHEVEKRNTLCAFVLFSVYTFCHKTTVAGDAAAAGGAGGALCAGASLVTVDVLTGHICSVSFCLYVPTERDKYVWLVQSRRRPVDQDPEGGLTRQCNTRPSFLIMCCLLGITVTRRLSTISPSTSS